jgi:hypothetical protein
MKSTNNNQDSTKQDLSNFILQMNAKNYAEANKYLQKVVESKLKQKIAKAGTQKLF